ncbi:hypothetical protein SAMN04488693_10487 [Arthrobacter subterraneus]|uniref:Uncharacterized protein n=1 Tax=Arthrobacter subterraneus TaxID=335973 RepID=A0A1G8GEM2_9MICC|nr:hypothetical protein [Arthrobacter subterraneus]SDH92818.1 hypothetical protein SAMN04488693_10487 [Arthrobacter subterraneus]
MEILWGALALVVAGALGSPITLAVLRLARAVDEQKALAVDDEAAPETGAALDEAAPDTPGVLRGGLVIGILERTAVALAILLNEPVAIAYVVAIKGLGRYAELKETPAAAERFIIGTLTSLLWACAVAGLTAVYLL